MSIAYTVALCAHDHADRLVRTLADLEELNHPQADWEFLVIDNGYRDGKPNLPASHRWPDGWQVREEKLGLILGWALGPSLADA